MSTTHHELDPAELSERQARLEKRFGELRGRL